MGTIYRKTPKGQKEIETRANRLAPRLRTALILVDGQRADNDLGELIAGDAPDTIRGLLDEGYIEVAHIVEQRRQPRAEDAPVLDSRVRAFHLRRSEAVRALIDQVGPLGEAVAIRLEKCSDWAQLEPTLELAREVLHYARGEAAAQEYASRFIEPLPGKSHP